MGMNCQIIRLKKKVTPFLFLRLDLHENGPFPLNEGKNVV